MVNRKIVSGGQTGADRAALDWAIAHGVRHGGWCPRGRKAEDGPIPRRYRLKETRSGVYAVRTRWNVRDSDGTVIFSVKRRLTGGTRRTRKFALKLGKPLLQLNAMGGAAHAGRRLTQFIRRHAIGVLNVAGPRASEEPWIWQFVWVTLTRSRLAFVSPNRK
jgi:Circularly permutated YpsA SLOG family